MSHNPGHYDYLAQERVIYGKPVAATVAEEAGRLGAKRVFIVAANTLVEKTDVIRTVQKALGESYAGLFHGTVAHTPRQSVIDTAEAARAAKADLIVTIGGGTAIDTVKAALICLAENVRDTEALGEFRIQVDDQGAPVIPAVKSPPLRQIIVPTTLSGAEFSNLAGVTDPARQIKDGYTAREICGQIVILDPAITVHTPDWLWLSTGIRSVDHAVETVCSAAPMALADATSLHALKMFGTCLPAIKKDPKDLGARLEAQLAVWLACAGLNRVPYGASHGIGHQLGAVAQVPHGYCSCVMLPSVLRYNREINAERQTMIAEAMGRSDGDAERAVADLVAALGLPGRLRDVGVKEDQLDTIAELSLENFMVRANPRPLSEPAQVREILDMAW